MLLKNLCAKNNNNNNNIGSGLIAQDKEAIQDAVTSVKRNGVGLKGVLYTKTDDVQQQSLNKLLR